MNTTDELEKLGEREVRKRLSNEGFGNPGSPRYTSVVDWLKGKEFEQAASLDARREDREEESLSISRKALRISYAAIIIAIMAIILPIIFALFIKN